MRTISIKLKTLGLFFILSTAALNAQFPNVSFAFNVNPGGVVTLSS